MAQLVIPGAAQVAINMECSGQKVVNVIGISTAGPTTATEIAEVVRAAWEKTGGPLKARPPQVKMISYKVTKLDAGGAVIDVASAATGGSSTSSLSTMAASALILLGGGSRDRSTRGRLYHGPITEGAITEDGRSILPAYAGSLFTTYKGFRDDIAAAGMSWSVLSRKNSIAYPIDIINVASIIATQRRRLR